MDDQILKNQYTLERITFWLINPIPREKHTWKKFSVSNPEKAGRANLPSGKTNLQIETPGKKAGVIIGNFPTFILFTGQLELNKI